GRARGQGHAGDHRAGTRRRSHRAFGHHLRRPLAGRRGFLRKRALRCHLSAPLPRPGGRMSVDTPKAALAEALARLDFEPRVLEPGHVWLAGAGPGDPRLRTLDVLGALAQADALVHDALVSPEIVAVAAQAEKFYVGKRGGRLSIPQEEINALLVKLGREGRKVVRLKGGHPYVFGRGGEEARALSEA